MKTVNEKIKDLRNQLHLSQDYVAKYLGVSRSTYTQIENGNRKLLADDIAKLSILFGVSADSLLSGTEIGRPAAIFARSFEKLDESDQAEIMNLIMFKEQIRVQRSDLKKKINYTVVCVNEFADRFSIDAKEAFTYLYDYKGIEFIKENYDIEHTLSIEDAVDDLTMICRNNGGMY